jgi:hypothetical protein
VVVRIRTSRGFQQHQGPSDADIQLDGGIISVGIDQWQLWAAWTASELIGRTFIWNLPDPGHSLRQHSAGITKNSGTMPASQGWRRKRLARRLFRPQRKRTQMQDRPRFPGVRVTANGNQLVSYHTETRIADAGVNMCNKVNKGDD